MGLSERCSPLKFTGFLHEISAEKEETGTQRRSIQGEKR